MKEFAYVWIHKGSSSDVFVRKSIGLMVAQHAEFWYCTEVHHNLPVCLLGRTDN